MPNDHFSLLLFLKEEQFLAPPPSQIQSFTSILSIILQNRPSSLSLFLPPSTTFSQTASPALTAPPLQNASINSLSQKAAFPSLAPPARNAAGFK